MAPQYIKKSVIVEALVWDGNEDSMQEFLGELFLIIDHHERLRIDTLEGIMWANLGDFIIKGVKGEFYPCKPDIFELTYDRV